MSVVVQRVGHERPRNLGRVFRVAIPAFWAPCAVLSLLTPPALAFRTSENSPALADKGRVGWNALVIPFVLSDQNLPPGLEKTDIELALSASLAAWAAPECSPIEPFFAGWTDEAARPMDGDNTIGWVTDWQARGYPSSAPGSTDVQYRGHGAEWRIAETDLYLNAHDIDWSTTEDQDTYLQAVLTHEIGHALGLLHPCEPDGEDAAPACEDASREVEATTMFPFYDASQSSLSQDDVNGLCYLYPVRDACGENECVRGEVCVDGECRAECHDQICPAESACGAFGCVPKGSCTARDCVGQVCDAKVTGGCGPLSRCAKGVCVRGTTRWGDKCQSSADCAQGACLGGVCQPDCLSDAECGQFGSCLPTADGAAQGCVSSSAYQDGLTCASGEDCRSDICIFTEKRNTCTSECQSSDTCDQDWSCKRVDGRNVCVPPDFKPTGGCRMSAAGGAVGFASVGWMMLGGALLATRRRHRRNDT